jgi:ribonuclease P/MRP protein subunit RPP1
MKREFADLHLYLDIKENATAVSMMKKAVKLGYRLIAVPLSPEITLQEIANMRKTFRTYNLDLVSRIDLQPKNHRELMYQLRRFRRKFELICVICTNKTVARQAAKDRRVDLLNFPLLHFRYRYFDKSEAELASKSLAALEIDVKPLILLEGIRRIRLISSLRREAAIAIKFNIPIVLSSGASAEDLLRKPKEMAALSFLFDLDKDIALRAVSHNPSSIVKRNREKLSYRFVAPGIRIIKDGKDC